MGGHGGLNILPQKRWNVYNFDNREKVRRDEEAAAREAHIRQQEQREKDAEARLSKLREIAKQKHSGFGLGIPEEIKADDVAAVKSDDHVDDFEETKLFEGLVSFKRLRPSETESTEYKGPNGVDKKIFRGDKELERLYKRVAKEATRISKDGVTADDEHYKLGYGCAGKDKKTPWYLSKSSWFEPDSIANDTDHRKSASSGKKRKKSIAELREERLMREKQERTREQTVLLTNTVGASKFGGKMNEGRRSYYNSSYGNAK